MAVACKGTISVAAQVLLTERRLPSTPLYLYAFAALFQLHALVGLKKQVKAVRLLPKIKIKKTMKRKATGQGKYVLKRRKTTNKSLNKAQAKAVQRVVKAALRKQDELKYFKYDGGVELGPDGTSGTYQYYRSYNLFFHNGAANNPVTRGVGDNNFLGDKLRWKGISLKYKVINGKVDGGVVWSDQPLTIDVMIIKAPAYYTTTSLPIGSLYNDTSSDNNHRFLLPGVKVLKKKTIRLTPVKAGDKTVRTGKIWLKRDQTIEYKDFDTNYDLKDGQNYYLYLVNRTPVGPQTYMSFAWQNYFIDS